MRNIRIPQVFTLIQNHLILHSKKQKSSENQLIFRTFLFFTMQNKVVLDQRKNLRDSYITHKF